MSIEGASNISVGWLLAVLLLCHTSAECADTTGTDLHGIVATDVDGEGQPIPGVSLVSQGASDTASDQFGRFKFHYRYLKPLAKVRVDSIHKNGWMLVNVWDLPWLLRSSESTDRLVLVLASPSERNSKQNAILSRLVDRELVDGFERRLSSVRTQQQAGVLTKKQAEEQLDKLTLEREHTLGVLRDTISQLIGELNAKPSSSYYQVAQSIAQGKLDEGLRRMEAVNGQAVGLTMGPAASERLLLESRLHQLTGNLDKAATTLQRAIKANPSNVSVVRDIGNIQFRQKKYEQSRASLNWAAVSAQQSSRSSDAAKALESLGALNYYEGSMQQALRNYSTAAALHEVLGRRGLGVGQRRQADVLLDLAQTQLQVDRPSDAKPNIEKALQLYGSIEGHSLPTDALKKQRAASLLKQIAQ